MKAAYYFAAVVCLAAFVVVSVYVPIISSELLAAVLLVACGVFCIAAEVVKLSEK